MVHSWSQYNKFVIYVLPNALFAQERIIQINVKSVTEVISSLTKDATRYVLTAIGVTQLTINANVKFY